MSREWTAAGLTTLLTALLILAPGLERALGQTPASVRVGTVIATRQPVTKALDFVGRVEAVERVEVRARVTGFIDAVLFKEGDKVEAGASLYRLEKPPFVAAVEQAQGALLKANGQVMNASAQRKRAEELLRSQSGSAAVRDQRVAEEETAKGDAAIAQASLETAKINLGYTDITAPIAGVIGRTKATKGNVVGPESGPLATIVSQDPMYVVIPVSQREFLDIQADERRAAGEALGVKISFSNGATYDKPGRINFIDTSVDRGTDTVAVRASVPNPSGTLIDGQLVRAQIAGTKAEEAVLVPQAALIADQQGVYVFVVEDGKAVVRRVALAGERGANAIIQSGLNGGEQVVVEGVEGLRPGTPVTASPVTPLASRS
ncbi:efflux RND transporter periplasmic adaptor subunit [Chelatococcus reniformis]|uniref:RND transporter MFP subunit n=1 Tax=Chelatococcus reniformis TaxID=1494448 RepID=A0A916X966_9HYPH|nr:efflux RND transporter periplasmic adaptor subunit [Chelatococcus reniformis]GGC53828.1 RND transporter MFP subunit [Chelatococcus reniformis]